jgi:hypothetical protein
VNRSQRLLHSARADGQSRLLRGRDGLPSAENAHQAVAARTAAADEDGAVSIAFNRPLSSIGISRRDARLVGTEARLQMEGQGERAHFDIERCVLVA